MKKLKVDLQNIKIKDLDLIIKNLREEKVVIIPTDTIYGLSAVATSQKGINKIYNIKNRGSEKKSLIMLVSSINMIKKYCYLSQKQEVYIKDILDKAEKPVSFLLKARISLPNNNPSDNSVVIRLPKNSFLIKLIERLGTPIVSTSFNKAGESPILDPEKTNTCSIANWPDLLVYDGASKTTQPSKIIDIRDMNNIIIVRE